MHNVFVDRYNLCEMVNFMESIVYYQVTEKNAHTKIVPVKKMKEFREEKKAQSLSYQPGPCADGGTDTCSSCMNEIGKRIYNSCPFGGKLLKKNY